MTLRNAISQRLVAALPVNATRVLGRNYALLANLIKYGDPYFPASMNIETSEFCNRHCWYCPNVKQSNRHGVITDEVFDCALRRLREIQWTGPVAYHYLNEPLLNPKLLAQIKATVGALPGCCPTLIANGDHLTVRRMEDLVAAGIGRVMYSRHEPFTEEWDRRFEEIRQRWSGLVQLTQVGKTVPVFTNAQLSHSGIAWQGKCYAPTLCFSFRINGDVSLCGYDFNREVVMGNVANDSIMEIWSRPDFVRMRKDLRNGKQVHPICNGCSGIN